MPVTGVYFVPSNPNSATALATVTERLRAAYDAVPIGRWALEHKLMRDTHSCLPPSAYAPLLALQPRFMQFLSLAHYPTHGFIYTSDRPNPDPWEETSTQSTTASQSTPTSSSNSTTDPSQKGTGTQQALPMTMMTPEPTSFISWFQITLRACEPLWCHRHTVAVQTGVVYEVADFRVRIGDVRQTLPVTRVRGTVVEIEYCGPGTFSDQLIDDLGTEGGGVDGGQANTNSTLPAISMEDWEIGEILIREFWARFSVNGAKEAIRVPDVGKEIREGAEERKSNPGKKIGKGDEHAGVDLARQYMEIFRFNR